MELNQTAIEQALVSARHKLNESTRRMLTFPATGELQAMPFDQVRDILITFNGSSFEVVNTEDKWTKEDGFSRKICAIEKLTNG